MLAAVVTDRALGGTFLSWSIYYLTGKDWYISRRNQSTTLCNNPLIDNTAHNFKVPSATTLDEFNEQFDRLVDSNELIYFHQFNDHNEDKAIAALKEKNIKIVALLSDPSSSLYSCSTSFRNKGRYYNSDSEKFNDIINTYFGKDLKHWQELGLTDVWDQREFLALNTLPNSQLMYQTLVDAQVPYLHIDSREAWNLLDNIIEDIVNYIGLEINKDRIEHWNTVYQQWRKIHYKGQRFMWCFDSIVRNIINNVDQDLTSFNLDIMQEAAIQRELIYKHNLNLKTFNLKKFENTQQLHNLLEPNQHEVFNV